MSKYHYLLISGVLFALVSVAHVLRIIYGVSVHVDGVAVPMLVSWIAFVVPGALAICAFRLARVSGST